jgi:NAD(P)-dependent dehydrogenase (short-subunit alcohol dehydrogenase family)
MGTLYFMQACFPYLKNDHGKVINLGSAAGILGQSGQSAYAVAKEGVRALTRVAAREWGRYGINVNVVCPLANSPGTERVAEETPERMKQMLASLAIRRVGDCEADIGRTVAFLASSDADYITGQTINVDGGASISA